MDRKRPREDDESGDAGGEISMSTEETNKLRISLGLKPLEMGGGKKADDSSRRHQEEQRKKREKEERAQRFKEKQDRKRQNAEDDFLAVKGLGEADEDDDMQSWVEKSRVADVAKRAEEKYAAREAAERDRKKQRHAEDDDEDADGGYTEADLAGMKVRHGVEDLHEGETMVLTLADQQLLDERGRTLRDDVDDELINTLKAEDRARQKARDAAAPKAKPLWEEDGKRRGLLDKYDEEEADVVLQLGEGGVLPAAQRDEMKRRLAEAGKILDSAAVGALAPTGTNGTVNGVSSGDYYTAQEAAPAAAGFKKKKKKERKLRAKSPGAEGGEEGTAALIEQLEAAQQQEQEGGSELGSRVSRATARERAEAQLREEAAIKRAKFEAAVAKGNWASQALKQQPASQQSALVVGDEDDADRELQESLARARRLAAQNQPKVKKEEDMDIDDKDAGAGPSSTLEAIAEAAAKRREAEEAALREELAAAAKLGKDRVVNDTIEFVRNIQATAIPAAGPVALGAASVAAGLASHVGVAAKKEEEKDDYMDLDEEDQKEDAPQGWATATVPAEDASGRWVSADSKAMDEDEPGPSGRAGQRKAKDKDEADGSGSDSDDGNPTREKALGRGLASVLGLLKERGDLQTEKHLQWAGRTNDRSKNALQGLIGEDTVYAGGAHEDKHAQRIEAALTIKDEFGRVMTPKERFRQLCYDFHGKRPSKNKEEKRVAKAKEEIARRHNATSEVAQGQEVEGLQKVTQKVAQPFVVLQGKGATETFKSLQNSMPPPPPRGKGGKERQRSAAPPPPGNLTPLLGDRKVEAMLNMNKPGSRLAPPPSGPPR